MNHYIPVDNSLTRGEMQAARGRICLGLCCINETLKPKGIKVNRGCIRRTFTVERALELAKQNVSDLIPILQYNVDHNIGSYRLSSDMFPHFTDDETESYTPTPEIVEILQKTGEFCKMHNQRLSMHPGQYTVLATPDLQTFEKAVTDLEHHAWILDTLQADDRATLCVHVGGGYGDMEATVRRWIERFDELPRAVKNRLAIENTERNGSVRECLTIAQECKIPIIYDAHHEVCYRYLHQNTEKIESIEDQMDEIVESWGGRSPLFHASDQDTSNPRVGTHSKFLNELPATQVRCCQEYDVDITIELECKAKEKAIEDIQEKYSFLFTKSEHTIV